MTNLSQKERPGNMLEVGRNHHNHAAPVGRMLAVKIKSLVKQEGELDVFRAASEVVNDVLLSELTGAPCPSLSRFDSLQRTTNRTRQQLRPHKRRRKSKTLLQRATRMLGQLTKYTGTTFSLTFVTVGGRVVHE